MESVIANVDDVYFDIEKQLEEQVGAQLLPFPGMDKSTYSVCSFYMKGMCQKGASCPFRHVRGDRTVVCKHWLRGLCKKGDQCEFLHEYDMTKMPECYFYSRFNACHNKECPFLHINPDSKMKDCPWYDRGFCRLGPLCRNRHVRRVLCMNYFAGFCPEGPDCKHMHPRFELPKPQDDRVNTPRNPGLVCNYCGEIGHRASHCFKANPELKDSFTNSALQSQMRNRNFMDRGYAAQKIDKVVCYKCGQQGHFANKCSKGDFAFLNSAPSPH